MSRVLVVEDEAHLAQGLRFNLQAEGYSAEVGERWRVRHETPARQQRKFRCHCARHYVAGQGWLQRGCRAARSAELCPGTDAHGTKPSGRCVKGLRGRRGRLFAQAFRSLHSAGASAGTAAAQSVDAEGACVGKCGCRTRCRSPRIGRAPCQRLRDIFVQRQDHRFRYA